MSLESFSPETVALMRADVATLGSAPDESLRLVLRLAAGHQNLGVQLGRHLGLNRNEFNALLALWDGGRCSMGRLAERISVSRAAMTALVDRLESDQFIVRAPHPDDRRALLLGITPRAEARLFELANHVDQRLGSIARSDPDAWAAYARIGALVRDALNDEALLMQQEKAAPEGEIFADRPEGASTPAHW